MNSKQLAAAPKEELVQAGEYPPLPEWSKMDNFGGLVPSEIRQELRAYVDADRAMRAQAAPKQEAGTYHLGACITDGMLHATVMRKAPGSAGAVTVLLSEAIPVGSLQDHDVVVDAATQAAPTSSASVEITDEQMHQGLAAAFAHPRAAAPDAVFKAGVDFGVSVALLQTAPTTQAAPQPAAQQGWDIDAAVEKAWGRFQAAMDKDEPLPPPSIHATAHYGTWLGREAHRHDEPKAGALRNAARMLAVLEAEIRRLHAELIAAQSAAPVAQRDVREETSIGKAVNRAARDLPEGWEIRIDLERHAGVVHLIDPEGNETMIEGNGELFSDQISAAIDAASSQSKEGA